MDNCLFLKGKLKFLILKTISKTPLHAYALRKKISELSENMFKPSFGSLYPALDDLVENKYLTVKEKENKKIYTITEKGKQHLNDLKKDFSDMGKQIMKTFKTYPEELHSEDMIKVLIAHQKLTGKILKEYFEDLYKFLDNYNKGKISKNDISKYESELRKSFEIIRTINKKYN